MRTAGRLLGGALVAAVLLGGCAAIPTSGPIGTGDVVLDDPAPALPVANDPPQDGSVEEIVNGFLAAGAAGLRDEFVVARKYLLAGTAWDPTTRVLVYPNQGGGPEIEVRADGSALVSVPVAGSVDASGVYTEAPPQAQEELVLGLAQDGDGQWRISELDDVVLLSASSFENVFRESTVYFATLDGSHLVPDVRWLPTSRLATSAVRALLAGPSPWLRDVVQTGAPEGTRLGGGAVTVSAQGAKVVLSNEAALADEGQRNLLLAQLGATLRLLPGSAVSEVQVTVGGGPAWTSTAVDEPLIDVNPGPGPYVLAEDGLALVSDGRLEPVPDVAPLAGLVAHDPAVSLDGQVRVVLAGATRLLLLAPDEAPATLLAGASLVAPSIDRFDWVWTAERASAGELVAVDAAGEVVEVAADWLEGRSVRSLRVSRDGARVVVVHTGQAESGVVVDVAAVVRDESGRPQRLGEERLQVGAVIEEASQVVWVDEGTLAVLGRSGSLGLPAVHLVPIGGPTDVLPQVDGTVRLAAGRGDRALYVADRDGTLWSRQGTTWVTVVTGVEDPSFPG